VRVIARGHAFYVLRRCAPFFSFSKALKEKKEKGPEAATFAATKPQRWAGQVLRFGSSPWNCCETREKGGFAHA
jgi:hypothetical protein